MMGPLAAILDAIWHEDDLIAGAPVTELTVPVDIDETTELFVKSTVPFGEQTAGAGDAMLLVDGEIIYASGRTLTSFTGLGRGTMVTVQKAHEIGTPVLDISDNYSAMGRLARGLVVGTAEGEDLDVIGRNLGLHRCPGLTEEQWRAFIKAVAYAPKTTAAIISEVLGILTGGAPVTVIEHPNQPWVVNATITIPPATTRVGRWYINSGERVTSPGGAAVDVLYTVNNVLGVWDTSDLLVRNYGHRPAAANLYAGTFAGTTIDLTAPVAPGTELVVDYGAFVGHFLAPEASPNWPDYLFTDPSLDPDTNGEDWRPYLSDPLVTARCMLDQVRAAGIVVNVDFVFP